MRVLGLGFLFWAVGTVLVRVIGHHLFEVSRPALIAVYAVSFAVMALFVHWLLSRLRSDMPRATAAALLVLPTLVLDPFTSLYASVLFPNLGPAAVSAFASCMLICCGGGLVGALWPRG